MTEIKTENVVSIKYKAGMRIFMVALSKKKVKNKNFELFVYQHSLIAMCSYLLRPLSFASLSVNVVIIKIIFNILLPINYIVNQ